MLQQLMISISGVRGVIGEGLTPEVVFEQKITTVRAYWDTATLKRQLGLM
ncbi:MAG: hypothetical protein ACREOI_36825 [bacterium]